MLLLLLRLLLLLLLSASCLINALPLLTHRPSAAQGHDLTDDWSLPGAHFVQLMPISVLVWVRSFIEPYFIKTMYLSTIPLQFI